MGGSCSNCGTDDNVNDLTSIKIEYITYPLCERCARALAAKLTSNLAKLDAARKEKGE